MEITQIERCHKQTDDLIATEAADFLASPIHFLKEHDQEFLYMESPLFEELKMDAVVFEYDEMFDAYTALFGLRLQKKYATAIKEYLHTHLRSIFGASSASFSGNEGLWEINIALTAVEGFKEDGTLLEALVSLEKFMRALINEVTAN